MKTFFATLLFIAITYTAKSQRYNPLKIGDSVPNLTITNFYNEPGKSIKMSSLYDKHLVILDFWGTWCAACLEELPKYNDLKKIFGNKIEIVAVGYESREKIATLFKRNPSLNSANYLTLYGDSTLTFQLFPHKSLPHVVWIDQNGKVVGITTADKVTKDNISNVLSGQPLTARIKKDNAAFGVSAISKPYHLKDSDFIYRSLFTKGIAGGLSFAGFQGGSDTETVYHFNRAFMGNRPIYELYWEALFLGRRSAKNYAGLKIETKDSLRYFLPKQAPISFKNSSFRDYDEWADSNLYVYDLVLPKRVEEGTIRNYMLQDLNRSLNLHGRYEMRDTDCWVLTKIPAGRQKQLIDSSETRKFHYPKAIMKTLDLKEFLELLNSVITEGIIIADDNIPQVKISINTAITHLNIEQLNRVIAGFDYTIKKGRKKVPIYIVSEY